MILSATLKVSTASGSSTNIAEAIEISNGLPYLAVMISNQASTIRSVVVAVADITSHFDSKYENKAFKTKKMAIATSSPTQAASQC